MNRLFPTVLIILAVLLCSSAWAKPIFGVKGGLNLANASEDPDPVSNSIKLGIALGGAADFSLSKSNTTTLRLEMLYAQKGWKESSGNYTGTAYLSELDIDPFLVLKFPSGGITPFIQGGPELGFNLSAKAKNEIGNSSTTSDLQNWSSTNFGINLGAGMALPAGQGEVVFDARYNLGLMNLYTGSGSYTVSTNGIQFFVGYNFKTSGK